MTYARVIGTARIETGPDANYRVCARCGIERCAGGSNATTCRACLNKTSGEQQPDATSTPCQERDPETWFPPAKDTLAVAYAKALCTACPVRVECLEYAITAGEQFGVWGGQSEDEIRAARERRRHQARAVANRANLAPEDIRTKGGAPVKHGTLHVYKNHGCSCEACCAANAAYSAARKARETA